MQKAVLTAFLMIIKEEVMSILEVKQLSHGFGDRAIFENVSFRLPQGRTYWFGWGKW